MKIENLSVDHFLDDRRQPLSLKNSEPSKFQT